MKKEKIGNHQSQNMAEEKELVQKKWLRSKHVRGMLGISDSTLQSMRISGAIPAYKLGCSWFYREDEIIDALERGRVN